MDQELTGYEKPLEKYTQKELAQIASKYKTYYQTPSGVGKIGGYDRLPKSKLIQIIKGDNDYQNEDPKLPKSRIKGRIKTKNRIEPIVLNLNGSEKPDQLMNEIIDALQDTNIGYVPIPGKYYTYIYFAKTPKIIYDRYPLIKAGELLERGFLGFNYHLGKGKIRQYNTLDGDRLVSGLYEVTTQEFNSLQKINYKKIIQN